MPVWDPPNLKKHFIKHPAGACAGCWEKALGKAAVTEPDYEAASLSVETLAWLAFRADYREDRYHQLAKTRYAIDKRMLVTVVFEESERVKTSFRAHSHEGLHDCGTAVDARVKLIERFNSWKFSSRKTLANPEQLLFKPGLADRAAYDLLNKKVSEFLMRPRTKA